MFGPGILRVILASLVVLAHTSGIKLGVVSVIAFFTLSGYWVTRQFDRKYRHDPTPVRTFYLSRFLRLWPAFVIALLLAVTARTLLGLPVDPVWPVALPLFGVASHPHDPLGVAWSLDIEMQFYLLAPLLFALLRGSAGTLFVLVALVPLCLLGWHVNDTFGFETVLITLSAFAAGALIHFRDLHFARWQGLASVAVAIGVLFVLRSGHAGFAVPAANIIVGMEGMRPNLLIGLCLIPLVGHAVRLTSGNFDRLAGDFSYSLYLVHFPLFSIVRDMTGGVDDPPGKLAMIAAAYAIGAAFFVLVDRPIDRWRVARVDARPGTKAT